MSVADYFEMWNSVDESNADTDLGSGGSIVLPDLVDVNGQTRHLAVGAGKDAHMYVVDRDAMGKWNPSSNQNYQDITGALSGTVFSTPAWFQQDRVLRGGWCCAEGISNNCRSHRRHAGIT